MECKLARKSLNAVFMHAITDTISTCTIYVSTLFCYHIFYSISTISYLQCPSKIPTRGVDIWQPNFRRERLSIQRRDAVRSCRPTRRVARRQRWMTSWQPAQRYLIKTPCAISTHKRHTSNAIFVLK